jgi:S-formylglutathione hydrolase FrmB
VKLAVRIAVVVLLLSGSRASAHILPRPLKLVRTNHRLHGCVVDYTDNHGHDNRIWSPALCQKRDLYVYLPPGFDCNKRYPFILWLHGFSQDEASFLNDVIPHLDRAIACGQLPPTIIAAPDGSFHGVACLLTTGSFFLNTPRAGAFEDYIMVDVWDFVMRNYPILPEPEAHIAAGVSMGGGAAFNKAIKYPDKFKSVLGIFPPVNLRWVDCHCKYMRPFDPCCWGWRTDFSRSFEVVGRFYGVLKVRQAQVIHPLYGRNNPDTAALVARENPIEMLDAYDVREGRLAMYIAYGGRDEFNITAQVESFLYRARERGLTVQVGYDPQGHHDRPTALRLMPGALEFLAERLAAYR